MKKAVVQQIVLLLLGTNFLASCLVTREQRTVSKPTIREDSWWTIVENCGYEHCYPLVDFLIGPDLRIRIESHNNVKDNQFVVLLDFFPKSTGRFKFDPSLLTVNLTNRGTLKGEAFLCSGLNWDAKHRRSIAPLNGEVPLDSSPLSNNCFLLFFDPPPPTAEEEFVMRIDGVTKDGARFHVPEVTFRKGIQTW